MQTTPEPFSPSVGWDGAEGYTLAKVVSHAPELARSLMDDGSVSVYADPATPDLRYVTEEAVRYYNWVLGSKLLSLANDPSEADTSVSYGGVPSGAAGVTTPANLWEAVRGIMGFGHESNIGLSANRYGEPVNYSIPELQRIQRPDAFGRTADGGFNLSTTAPLNRLYDPEQVAPMRLDDQYDKFETVLHELGHVLGLYHPGPATDPYLFNMNETDYKTTGMMAHGLMSQQEIDTLRALYDVAPDYTRDYYTGEYSPYQRPGIEQTIDTLGNEATGWDQISSSLGYLLQSLFKR